MLHSIIAWLTETVGTLGYPGIIALMALESSFFPFPSEVVMVPAGYLASKGEMNIVLVITCGVLGSVIGSYVNYMIAVKLGRGALLRFGKYFFLTPEKFAHVESYSKKHGEISTFIGRLLPVIRQYISFPAGLVRMPLGRFTFFTALGAGIWMTVLAVIGYVVGENEELVHQWSKTALFWVLIGCAVIVAAYIHFRKPREHS